AQLLVALDHPLRQPRRDTLELLDSPPVPLPRLAMRLEPALALPNQSLRLRQLLAGRRDGRIAAGDRGVDLAWAVAEQGPLEATLADAQQARSALGRHRPDYALFRNSASSSSSRGASPHNTSIR